MACTGTAPPSVGRACAAATAHGTNRWLETNVYALTNSNGILKAFINNKPVFSGTAGVRVVTDLQGNIQQVIGIDSTPHAVTLTVNGKGHKATVVPNAVYKIKSGKLALHRKVPFDYKP
jgi:hypothetical protein